MSRSVFTSGSGSNGQGNGQPARAAGAGDNGVERRHDQPGANGNGAADAGSSAMQKWLPPEGGKALSPEKLAALEMLTAGVTIREAAAKIGLARQSVYRWIRRDAGFRAAYHAWQQEHRESCRAGLLRCAEMAVASVAATVAKDPHLAFMVCKQLGLFKQVDAATTIEPDMVKSEIEVEQMKEKARIYGAQIMQMLKNAGLTTEQAREAIRRRSWELENPGKSKKAFRLPPPSTRITPGKRRKRASTVGAFRKPKLPKMNARIGTSLTRSSALQALTSLSPGMAKKLFKGA